MDAAINPVPESNCRTANSINASARDHGVSKNGLSRRVKCGANPGPLLYLSSVEQHLVEYLRSPKWRHTARCWDSCNGEGGATYVNNA